MMDLKFIGAIDYKHISKPCVMAPDAFDFMTNDIQSQWVVTESAATCLANSMSMGALNNGNLHLNEKKTNELFNVTDIKTDTSSMAAHIPLFQ
jgi:hypothetical protein